eukprot:scaffold654_cov207-Ochromonas_danica.AAC.57
MKRSHKCFNLVDLPQQANWDNKRPRGEELITQFTKLAFYTTTSSGNNNSKQEKKSASFNDVTLFIQGLGAPSRPSTQYSDLSTNVSLSSNLLCDEEEEVEEMSSSEKTATSRDEKGDLLPQKRPSSLSTDRKIIFAHEEDDGSLSDSSLLGIVF